MPLHSPCMRHRVDAVLVIASMLGVHLAQLGCIYWVARDQYRWEEENDENGRMHQGPGPGHHQSPRRREGEHPPRVPWKVAKVGGGRAYPPRR